MENDLAPLRTDPRVAKVMQDIPLDHRFKPGIGIELVNGKRNAVRYPASQAVSEAVKYLQDWVNANG